jgi:hypothetical protein
MNDELEKIDIIRSRFNVSYEQAHNALTSTSGDVIAALAAIERSQACRPDLLALGAEVADEVQHLVNGGPIRKLRLKYGNRVITEKPVALTAAAAIAAALAAVLVTKLAIEVERTEEEAAS